MKRQIRIYNRLILVLWFALLGAFASTTLASTNQSSEYDWSLYSEATAKWLWLDIYQAKLFVAPANQKKVLTESDMLHNETPLKLELCYEQSISAEQMIEAADKVLNKQKLSNKMLKTVSELHNQYQNVVQGDCYTLMHTEEMQTHLMFNGKGVFSTSLPDFKALYFGIWLGNEPLSEELKTALLKGNS